RELVEEAALQPAAVSEEPVVRERHVLRLRHLHGDRLELSQMRAAAELPAARADAVEQTRGVARADLPHLHARAELAREVADELTEIDALVGAEEHGHAARGRMDLDVDDLHREVALPREALCGEDPALLALAPLAILARFVVGRE